MSLELVILDRSRDRIGAFSETDMADQKIQDFQRAVSSVAAELVEVLHRSQVSYIRTPLLYPSGTIVVVRIDPGISDFIVSDRGMGFDEADMMGGSHMYDRQARPIAEEAGVGFDHRSFFALQVSRAQLAGAVITIANCSQQAVVAVANRLSERDRVNATDVLYDRLTRIFEERHLARNAELRGASNTAWSIPILITSTGRKAAFEAVSPHHNSVVSAAAKFHDLSLLEKPPTRVSAIGRKADFKTWLGVLNQTSNVIETKASDTTIRDVVERKAA